MKKFLHLFAKGKRSKENFYSLQDASLHDKIENHFNESNIFINYPFDGYGTNKLVCGVLLNSRVGINNSQECPAPSLSSSHLITSTETDSLDVQTGSDFSHFSHNNLSSDDLGIKMQQEKKCKSEERKKKARKNLCLINISNSKYFHIGSQNTVNIREKSFIGKTAQAWQPPYSYKNCSSLKVNFKCLLDCEERVSEKHILLISQNVDDQWKGFLRYLGLEKTALDTLELRNYNNRIFSVYDALQKYITQFPDTSLGFVIYALIQIHQVFVIEKLMQELQV